MVLSAAIMACMPSAAYTLDLTSGTLPADVKVTNETGVNPSTAGYQRGYTRDGWIVEEYGTYGHVALSPTYTGKASACRNRLLLPATDITDGHFLKWNAASVLRERPESYLVEAKAEDDETPVILFSTDSEAGEWTTHMVDLSPYAGKKLTISFVCVSENRYMLAIGDVTIDKPEGMSFDTVDLTEVFCDASSADTKHAPVTLQILNSGTTRTNGAIELEIDGTISARTVVDTPWITGETRVVTLSAPVKFNEVTVCRTYFNDSPEKVMLAETTLYSSTFKKHLLVDKGTGMWCPNCTKGVLEIQDLERNFGSSVIAVETHNGDKLKNDAYNTRLNFPSYPYMMLNRIRSSAGTDMDKFGDYFYTPTKFGIGFSSVKVTDKESATVNVTIECAETIDNSTDRYRVGYVLTGDFHKEEENPAWYQRNICTLPSQREYYYLPTTMISPLSYFNNTSLTSDHAFDGFAGSLPALMTPGTSYAYSWSVERPQLLDDIRNGRVVAMVLDTSTGEVMNCAAFELTDAEVATIGNIKNDDNGRISLRYDNDGNVTVTLAEAGDFILEVWSADGRKEMSVSSHAANSATVRLPVCAGLHVIKVTCKDSTKTTKVMM